MITFFSATNTPPVAKAGPDQTVSVGDVVTLDGGASVDADGDLLTYTWRFVSRPAGSVATLSDPTLVNPQFQVDKAGTYAGQLVVTDGFAESEPDTVAVSTTNSAPVANAGPDLGVTLGQVVPLRGDGSFDADGDALSFSWSLTAVPAGSAATLSDPTAATPTLVVDVFGTYEATLVVHDGQVASKPDTVVVTTANVRPTANAGPDQAVAAQDTALLDGQGSVDPEGVAVLFRWSFAARPAGSLAILSDPASPTPTFVPDGAGTYVVQLIVSDGLADSQPDTASITAVSSGTVLGHLKNAINLLSAMPTGAFVDPNRGRALIKKLEAIVRRIEDGHLAAARHQLRKDLLPKVDGCAPRGSADRPAKGKARDWITDCQAQSQVHAEIKDALDALVLLIGA
ncbi:MAG: hypothetical protein HYS77_16985 [Candidatus Rokubacteria bacterium]|nr:hypothetical protein [Candidatus Rokubacteria bacterium]